MRRPVRLVVWVALAILAVVALFTIVFPWASRTFFDDPTLEWTLSAADGTMPHPSASVG